MQNSEVKSHTFDIHSFLTLITRQTPIEVFTTAHTIFISNYCKTPFFALLDLLATNIDKRSRCVKTSFVQYMEKNYSVEDNCMKDVLH